MKFIDEVDIELVNQELNFQSSDNNLVIKGGCDLFTTKAIGSDRKLFKTIDKHLNQILEDNQLSQSIEQDRKNSLHSIFGSSASPNQHQFSRRSSNSNEPVVRDRRSSSSSLNFNRVEFSRPSNASLNVDSNLSSSLLEENSEMAIDESPFGPLKSASTRKTFAYLVAILNATYPDHDFSNLQPSTENFHKLDSAETLMNRFNSLMVSLGKKEDLLSWIWDTINVYMDIIPPRSPTIPAQNSRKPSFNANPTPVSPNLADNITFASENACKIYEFQPSDSSILEDLNHPYQTMWSNYWFIYNKKKKRVCFLYLTAINQVHFSELNRSSYPMEDEDAGKAKSREQLDEELFTDDYMDEDHNGAVIQDEDIIGDIEL